MRVTTILDGLHLDLRTCAVLLALAACACTTSSGIEPPTESGTEAAADGSTGTSGGNETTSGPDGTTEGDTEPETDTGPDANALYHVFTRIQTPAGRTMYASMVPSLADGEVDLAQSLELSGFSRGRVFSERLYAFDGESAQITRYAVADDGTLAVDALDDGSPAQFSLAGLGVTFFYDTIVFIDETRAFYFDFEVDLVVEWNPSDMTITESYEGGMKRDGFDTSSGSISVLDDTIVVPLSWGSGATGTGLLVNAVGLLDISAPGALQIIEDDRCAGTTDTFVHDGSVYALGDNFGGLGPAVSTDPLPAPCLLRWTPGATAFDPDYALDLSARVGFDIVAGVRTLGDGTVLLQAYTSDEDPMELGLFPFLDGPNWERVLISLEGDETTMLDAGGPGALGQRGWAIDGAYVFPRVDSDAGTATLYRVEDGEAVEQLTVTGEVFHLDRVR
ncbi:MAG: hypothetical protein AAGA54_32415 [Myxococcota bacterium]